VSVRQEKNFQRVMVNSQKVFFMEYKFWQEIIFIFIHLNQSKLWWIFGGCESGLCKVDAELQVKKKGKGGM
jgi:hypothetical protein